MGEKFEKMCEEKLLKIRSYVSETSFCSRDGKIRASPVEVKSGPSHFASTGLAVGEIRICRDLEFVFGL